MKKIFFSIVGGVALACVGCTNTFHGIGRDMEQIGGRLRAPSYQQGYYPQGYSGQGQWQGQGQAQQYSQQGYYQQSYQQPQYQNTQQYYR